MMEMDHLVCSLGIVITVAIIGCLSSAFIMLLGSSVAWCLKALLKK
jgi:hypothetical protein